MVDKRMGFFVNHDMASYEVPVHADPPHRRCLSWRRSIRPWDGQAIFNGAYQMLNAALSARGLAFLPEDLTLPHLQAGRLQRVLADWCPVFPGLHAYYPSRRQSSRALNLMIDAIRLRSD